MKFFYLIPLLLAACSPQNYEDCVIEGVKEVSSDAGANAIRYACRSKFPEKSSTIVDTFSYDTFQESIWGENFSHGLKVEANEIISGYSSFLATNKNDEIITNITIGTSLTPTCLPDKNNYSQLISCQGQIPANSTNRIECKTTFPENVEFCIVSVEYKDWVDHSSLYEKATPKPTFWQTIKEML